MAYGKFENFHFPENLEFLLPRDAMYKRGLCHSCDVCLSC